MRDGACLGVQERLAALEPLTAAETVHLTQCPGCARLMSRRDRLAEAFEFACPEPASVDGRGAALDSETRPVGHALRAEVEAQPPAQRMAILLCYGHGLDTAEIAGLLGVGVGTVRTLLVWGLEGLQDDAGPGVGAGARAGAGAEVR